MTFSVRYCVKAFIN